MTKEVAEKIVRGITDKIECNTVDIDDWAEFWGFTREEYEEFLDVAIKALEQTELNPSYNSVKTELEQQSRWIPVSQGLPEDARNVLITVNPYGMVVPGWYSNESKLWYRLSQGRWAEVIDTECDVIAWQYFPEPYKEDSNGSES